MDRGVLYLMAGLKHINHLVVSLQSLKDHWTGPVCIAVADNDAKEAVRGIVEDSRMGSNIFVEDISKQFKGGRNRAYFLKTSMLSYSPFEETVFIDADTLIVDDFSEVFPQGDEVVLTHFKDWVTTGKIMRGRIGKWAHVLPERVKEMQAAPYPALNTGVIGFSKRCTKFAELWPATTAKNIRFICDEIAAQLLYVDVPHRILDSRWNMSYSEEKLDEAKIIHGHGFKFIRTDKGRRLWLPKYYEALEANLAGIEKYTDVGKYAPIPFLRKEGIIE